MSKVICNHLGCKEEVDQTTDTICGGTTGEDEYSCGKCFCLTHLESAVLTGDDQIIYVCDKCEDYLIDSGECYKDQVEECLVKLEI